MSGVSVPASVTAADGTLFREAILFTHRGLSGPAVLQISSYWQPGEYVSVNLLPDLDLAGFLDQQRQAHPNQSLKIRWRCSCRNVWLSFCKRWDSCRKRP